MKCYTIEMDGVTYRVAAETPAEAFEALRECEVGVHEMDPDDFEESVRDASAEEMSAEHLEQVTVTSDEPGEDGMTLAALLARCERPEVLACSEWA